MSKDNINLMNTGQLYNNEPFGKTMCFKNSHIESLLNDLALFKTLSSKISSLIDKIEVIGNKLNYKKIQELSKSMESTKHLTETQNYLHSIKNYIMDDEDTESSSDDSYSNIDNMYGGNNDLTQRVVNKYHLWLVERCNFQSKWSWLLSEIQSTEFRLKHLRKYSEEIRHLKRKYCPKSDCNGDDSARNKYNRLEKRKRVQIHNLLSNDLIKFVSPLYSSDDHSSDKFIQCKCRLGDIGPCILCCGMKNKISEFQHDIDKEDIYKASILDNGIHTKLSSINDVRNQMKRNVLFNGYIKNPGIHWSYPRARTSLSPILSAPPQPKIDVIRKSESVNLEFCGIRLDKKDFKIGLEHDFINKIENDNLIDHSNIPKVDIKLPSWKKIDNQFYQSCDINSSKNYQNENMRFKSSNYNFYCEDIDDQAYIKRHEVEEALERRRNYPITKVVELQSDLIERNYHIHGYEYKRNSEQCFDLRLFPLLSEDLKQLSHLSKNYVDRSKRFKRRIKKF